MLKLSLGTRILKPPRKDGQKVTRKLLVKSEVTLVPLILLDSQDLSAPVHALVPLAVKTPTFISARLRNLKES